MRHGIDFKNAAVGLESERLARGQNICDALISCDPVRPPGRQGHVSYPTPPASTVRNKQDRKWAKLPPLYRINQHFSILPPVFSFKMYIYYHTMPALFFSSLPTLFNVSLILFLNCFF